MPDAARQSASHPTKPQVYMSKLQLHVLHQPSIETSRDARFGKLPNSVKYLPI